MLSYEIRREVLSVTERDTSGVESGGEEGKFGTSKLKSYTGETSQREQLRGLGSHRSLSEHRSIGGSSARAAILESDG